jgi:hypothetical protein
MLGQWERPEHGGSECHRMYRRAHIMHKFRQGQFPRPSPASNYRSRLQNSNLNPSLRQNDRCRQTVWTRSNDSSGLHCQPCDFNASWNAGVFNDTGGK